jgi:hypothetical protein
MLGSSAMTDMVEWVSRRVWQNESVWEAIKRRHRADEAAVGVRNAGVLAGTRRIQIDPPFDPRFCHLRSIYSHYVSVN